MSQASYLQFSESFDELITSGSMTDKFGDLQITGETVGEVRPVSGMHQRKAEMARQADAFIALPGNSSLLDHHLYCSSFSLDRYSTVNCDLMLSVFELLGSSCD